VPVPPHAAVTKAAPKDTATSKSVRFNFISNLLGSCCDSVGQRHAIDLDLVAGRTGLPGEV